MKGKMHEPTPGIMPEKAMDEGVKEHRYACEVCKTEYGHKEAKVINWACCGHDLSRLEVLYRSEPSPTGA